MNFIAEFFWNVVAGVLWLFGAIAAFVVLFALYSISKGRDDERTRQVHLRTAKDKIERIVTMHVDTLARQRMAMVRLDRYGVVEAASWQKEVQRFVDKVVVPALDGQELAAVHGEGIDSVFQVLIEDRVRTHQEQLQQSFDTIDGLSHTEFEAWCNSQLEKLGWSSRLTSAGADQGADIIATREGASVAIQCKLYDRPVGNSAVQEAFAAKQHYGTTASAVVTNSSYTKSAKELAGTTGVILLMHTELELLNELAKQ